MSAVLGPDGTDTYSIKVIEYDEAVALCDGSEQIQEVFRLLSSQRLLFKVESLTVAQGENSPKPVDNVA
ncbi:hypothetical protein KIN20_035349 [Parelaphostrongylus tenuis]|uniref:Uncharacterized protein n=1 Tax=Parelaphostrongylus tenuis TaxID=148309 RepID=A0AAD5RBP2_PARTN|nr:hypothetical protein KIN20_035349 [Parelaphostrongylus tenuis]